MRKGSGTTSWSVRCHLRPRSREPTNSTAFPTHCSQAMLLMISTLYNPTDVNEYIYKAHCDGMLKSLPKEPEPLVLEFARLIDINVRASKVRSLLCMAPFLSCVACAH